MHIQIENTSLIQESLYNYRGRQLTLNKVVIMYICIFIINEIKIGRIIIYICIIRYQDYFENSWVEKKEDR